MSKYVYGIDLGGTTVKFGFFLTDGTLFEKWELPTDRSENGKNIIPQIVSTVKNHTNAHCGADDVAGIGVAVPGPVTSDGFTPSCPNLGWVNVNVISEFKKFLPYNINALNDANAAALGELWRGSGKKYSDFVFMTLGTGVGGAVVIDRRLISGAHSSAGEFGHIPIVPDGHPCNCGRMGCLEQYASATALVRIANEYLASQNSPSLLREIKFLTAKDIWDAACSGDSVAGHITDLYCNYIARGAAAIAAVCDPQAFIIGGGVSKAGTVLAEGIKKHYERLAFPSCAETEFHIAALSNDAGITGSAYSILHS